MKGASGRLASADLFVPFRKTSQLTGWRGSLYATLERVAPVTRSSPLRRAVQIVCLALFLYAFFVVCWPYAERFDETTFSGKETYPVELFLLLDPLVGLSTVLAGRFFNLATLAWTAGILGFCVLVPRFFCGYLCPLGTLIDGFDWLIGDRFKRFQLSDHAPRGGWVHVKYYLLVAVLVAALGGVLTSGFVSAIPVLTRGFLFTAGRAQLALLKGPGHLHPVDAAFWVSIALFVGVFALSLLGRRFWCRYVCPSGALLSVFNRFRVGERKVDSNCINCNKCIEICPFDAIQEDFHTRTDDCTYCQTCGGVCPTHAIKFVTRWNRHELKVVNDPPVRPRPVSRRAFLGVTALTGAAAVFVPGAATSSASGLTRPVRPPGSVPEDLFQDLCIRCGQCFQVCPGPVLGDPGFEFGWQNMWTPVAQLDHSGCHQDCNACTLVCPTGAIQPLTIDLKRKTHMGLAKVNTSTCLPFREDDRQECDLCFVECEQAGYHAIEMREIEMDLDPPPPPGMFSDLELRAMSRIQVPVIDADACVGCGICQSRCHTTYVIQQDELTESAIVVSAEYEHRLEVFPEDPQNLPRPT